MKKQLLIGRNAFNRLVPSSVKKEILLSDWTAEKPQHGSRRGYMLLAVLIFDVY